MADKAKREPRADHEWINARGDVVKRIDDATGTRYTLLANGESLDMQVGDLPPETHLMAALFGVRTRATNVSSTSRNAGGEDADAQFAAISEFWDMLLDGEWGAGRAAGISLVLLAQACVLADGGVADDERLKRVKVWLKKMSDDERAVHAKRPKIVLALARIRADKAQARARLLAANLGDSDDGLEAIPA